MAIIKKTLSLTPQDHQWIESLIASGEYVSSSEYVQNLIRRDKEQRRQIEAIRSKLDKAEQSGFTDQTAEEILATFKGEARRNGKL